MGNKSKKKADRQGSDKGENGFSIKNSGHGGEKKNKTCPEKKTGEDGINDSGIHDSLCPLK